MPPTGACDIRGRSANRETQLLPNQDCCRSPLPPCDTPAVDARIYPGQPRMRQVVPLLPRGLTSRRSGQLQLLALALILLVAAAFRLNALGSWDDNSHQHPDERFMTIVASQVSVPTSIGDYFNTAHSSLNPYANGQSNYAYG